MEQTMIKTENVSKRFGSFALQDIHFELPAGYICGLIGENGVGKTTLLNILAGLYEYDGTISIQEKESVQIRWNYSRILDLCFMRNGSMTGIL